jgi:hypothetical protein
MAASLFLIEARPRRTPGIGGSSIFYRGLRTTLRPLGYKTCDLCVPAVGVAVIEGRRGQHCAEGSLGAAAQLRHPTDNDFFSGLGQQAPGGA